MSKMKRTASLLMAFIIVLLGGTCAWAFVIYVSPEGEVAKLLERFQTLMGGVFAVFAAVIGAIALLVSTSVSVRRAELKEKHEIRAREIAGAAIIKAELEQFRFTVLNRAGGENAIPVDLPEALKDLELLASQSPKIVHEISRLIIVGHLLSIPAVNVGRKGPQKKDAEDETANLKKFSDDVFKLTKTLHTVVGKSGE